MDIEAVIREYLPQVAHMSLGTSSDNKPWVCEVHFVYDEDLNLYFMSKPDSRHCQEITQNPSVAGNIVTQHPLGQKPRGIYYEGTCELIEVTEDSPIAKLFYDRWEAGPDILGHGKEIYKITVSDYYVFDARETQPSQKFHLPRK